jgi:large subunit ribosomal protein L5
MTAEKNEENKMRTISVDSITLHCSTPDPARLAKAEQLLERISKAKSVRTIAKKRIPTWKIKPGMDIGCKVTLRGEKAVELLQTLLKGVQEFEERQFNPGSFAFGIKEYIQIPSISYQRDIGIIGFEVMVALKRPGFRVARRRYIKTKISSSHKISKFETIEFFKKNFNINVKK